MSAPASAHTAQRAAWDRLWRLLLAADEPPPEKAPATPQEPEGARSRDPFVEIRRDGGAKGPAFGPLQHEDHVSALQERDVAFEEDDRHVPTSTDI